MNICAIAVMACLPALALAQNPAARDDQGGTFRVSVTLVQVDAVVTDAKGKHVADLKADDFEVFQDGKPQRITHFSYVSTPSIRPPVEPKKLPVDRNAPPPPPSRLRPEQVRRTMALVVDDLGLSFESLNYVRQALKKFVDEQLQPGDLAAIIRSGAGMGALQQFTSDKRLLHAAIDRIRWSPFGRQSLRFTPTMGSGEEATAEDRFEEFQEELFSVGTLGAVTFAVRGLRDLPGRKSIVLFSDGLRILNSQGTSDRVMESLRRLTDQANRASAVIYTIDARGLVTLMPSAAESGAPADPGAALAQRSADHFESQNGLNFLAQQTGGLFYHDRNDIDKAVAEVLEDQSGYYLIGYTPFAPTFQPVKGGVPFHRIRVRVKRPGLRLRSRDGFYGVPDQTGRPAKPRGRDEQLFAALSSPLASGGVHLRLSSLFANNPKTGPFLYSMLHMDAKDFSFSEEPDGWRKAVIDILVSTFGDSGVEVDRSNRTYTVRLRGEEYKKVLERGFVYSVRHPVKKPGAYQLRVAVRDASTENVGSANQFVEVPDLKKGRLALSGITVKAYTPSKSQPQAAATPAAPELHREGQAEEGDPLGNPAVRVFHAGGTLIYAYEVFNGRKEKDSTRPQVETQVRLFHDGKLAYTGKPSSTSANPTAAPGRVFGGGFLRLGKALAPGDYVLQVIATDKLARQKYQAATQWIDFEVRP